MNVIDSSGWIEYFADAENADYFAKPIEQTNEIILPTISIYEVFKHVLREECQSKALEAIAYMKQGRIVDLNVSLAIEAAGTSHSLKIPMADSIILTTARSYQAQLWTQDADFKGIDGVHYIPKSE
jgi:predicted nucleic acid-binding protein